MFRDFQIQNHIKMSWFFRFDIFILMFPGKLTDAFSSLARKSHFRALSRKLNLVNIHHLYWIWSRDFCLNATLKLLHALSYFVWRCQSQMRNTTCVSRETWRTSSAVPTCLWAADSSSRWVNCLFHRIGLCLVDRRVLMFLADVLICRCWSETVGRGLKKSPGC